MQPCDVRASAPFRYTAYGLRIGADRPLPALLPDESGPPDVRIAFVGDHASMGRDTSGTLIYPAAHTDRTVLRAWRTEDGGLRLTAAYRDEYCTFSVGPAGADVRVAWSACTPLQDVLLYLLGPVLGAVLRQRGVICLHGSVVSWEGQAAVLLGSKGAGKSTTATALLEHGCAMLADDVAVITEVDGAFWVQPGYPGVRLRPDPAAHLFGSESALPGLWSDAPDREHVQRRYLDLRTDAGRFSPQPVPFGAVYLLGRRGPTGGIPQVQSLPRMESLLALAANAYVPYALTEPGRVREWQGLERVLKAVPARYLARAEGLDTLPETCAALLEDLHRLRPATTAQP